jgi:tetratricopeptide (TPR) repeat protein
MATSSELLAIAIQHHLAGRLQIAEQIYRQILAVEPGNADALHLVGVIAKQAGKFEIAIKYIEQAIQLNGTDATFHNSLGMVYRSLGVLPDAVACYRRAVQLKPDLAEANYNLGNALRDQGKLDEAVACYRRALEFKPNYADAYCNLGNALKDQGNLDDAVACFRRALEIQPDFAVARNNLGNTLKDQGKLEDAVACFREALASKPNSAAAHYNLGNALKDQGKLDDAANCYRRALELKPDFAEAHNNLGNVLKDQGKLDDAVARYRAALELKPDYADAHNNLGTVFMDQGKPDDAVACYGTALELKPDYAEAHLNRAHIWLLKGDWQRGWPEYEWRWKTMLMAPRRFPQPLWDGAPLAGQTILLHAEQGFGDTIQFIRYASIVAQLGGTVRVVCQKPLLGLLEACPGIDQLVAQGDDLPAFNVHAPLLSLPGILKTSVTTIPAPIPYLAAKPALVEQWRKRLSQLDGFKIGISWQGNPKFRGDNFRSIPLRYFAPLAQVPGVHLISVQKGVGTEQLAEFRKLFPVMDLASELGDFADTAAVLKNLDLVITSDTAVAHLAGALGVPVWVALSIAPDWRWLLDRADCPWYPTMRLFRQKAFGDWSEVFARIAAEACESVEAALR